MKFLKPIFFLTLLTSLFASCSKDEGFDPFEQFEKEKPMIASYVEHNYPNMEYNDTTGIHYEIIEPGTQDSYEYKIVDTVDYYGNATQYIKVPTVTVRYTGKLITDNTVFDSNQSEKGMQAELSGLISAWQIAFLPQSIEDFEIGGLTKKGLQIGSKIRIVTPSYYAYGNRPSAKIPANSPLFFEIEVVDIK